MFPAESLAIFPIPIALFIKVDISPLDVIIRILPVPSFTRIFPDESNSIPEGKLNAAPFENPDDPVPTKVDTTFKTAAATNKSRPNKIPNEPKNGIV